MAKTRDGLYFLATINRLTGERLTRETENRAELVAWVTKHTRPYDQLTLVLEARGEAVPAMLAALSHGLTSEEPRG
jgi:hypothetical protein